VGHTGHFETTLHVTDDVNAPEPDQIPSEWKRYYGSPVNLISSSNETRYLSRDAFQQAVHAMFVPWNGEAIGVMSCAPAIGVECMCGGHR
jgi:hypothetical protein